MEAVKRPGHASQAWPSLHDVGYSSDVFTNATGSSKNCRLQTDARIGSLHLIRRSRSGCIVTLTRVHSDEDGMSFGRGKL